MRILIAEDEPYLRHILEKLLKSEGYAVDACGSGREALDCLHSTAAYDAAVLDILMPEGSGLDVLSDLRLSGSKLPVLLLTAKDSVSDRVAGLDAGADDYLIKPFDAKELLARVRALLRRGPSTVSTILTAGDLTVDPARHQVQRGGKSISLSGREFSILAYMLRNKGTVLSRRRIEEHIWNYDYQGSSNVVDVYIRSLREKIEDQSSQKLIRTVRGVGYVIREEE